MNGTDTLFEVLEATWPPAQRRALDGWIIRDGQGGGQRVSAATQDSPDLPDISVAERAMLALEQPPIFMVRPGQIALDAALEKRGYRVKDETLLYTCPTGTLTQEPVPPMTAFSIWPPLAIQREIWAAGGIGPKRIDVMMRAQGPKTTFLARASERAAGAAFVAVARKTAMIHALEVPPTQRRQGVGNNMLRAAAHWAQDQGATEFSLAVTAANTGANALYLRAGLQVVGQYHYRVKNKT